LASYVPIPIVLPFLAAAVLVAIDRFVPRWAMDVVSALAGLATTAFCALLYALAMRESLVHWVAGWTPHEGVAIGIALHVDVAAAGFALLAASLGTASLLYASRYYRDTGHFHSMALVLLGAMVAFCFSGDLFTMFVFFELMSVCGIVLAAHKREEASLQGAITFGIVHTVAGVLILLAIGLVYGRTGALNLAQIGRELGAGNPDVLVLVALALVAVAMLVKAAIAPFHAWAPDAVAVAPIPVAAIFSGVMEPLGIFGLARIYRTAFDGLSPAVAETFAATLLGLGAATALVGAVMSLLQRHLKRLLAFTTVSHMGMGLMGVGLMSTMGFGGAVLYLVGHGFLKASLFLAIGVVLHRTAGVDEIRLHAQVRGLRGVGAVFLLAGFGLLGVPPFGTFAGKAMMEQAAEDAGKPWVVWVLVAAAVLTAAAVLRAGARVFFGLGPRQEPDAPAPTQKEIEGRRPERRVPAMLWVMPLLLLAAAVPLGVGDVAQRHAYVAGDGLLDGARYERRVLREDRGEVAWPLSEAVDTGSKPWVFAGLSLVAALALTAWELRRREGGAQRHPAKRKTPAWQAPLAALHSGHAGDYVAFLVLGLGGLATILVLSSR
jgi:multicomponent Na+:H+ antiporter subunit D